MDEISVQAKIYYMWEPAWWVIISIATVAILVLIIAVLGGRRSN
jgi:hypothetical protein